MLIWFDRSAVSRHKYVIHSGIIGVYCLSYCSQLNNRKKIWGSESQAVAAFFLGDLYSSSSKREEPKRRRSVCLCTIAKSTDNPCLRTWMVEVVVHDSDPCVMRTMVTVVHGFIKYLF
uniref:Uncharacterized protein n=1 Tax=Octactis speculum TaxID=3111310 RepID=A0A7S2C8H7_9STRA